MKASKDLYGDVIQIGDMVSFYDDRYKRIVKGKILGFTKSGNKIKVERRGLTGSDLPDTTKFPYNVILMSRR